MILTRDVLYLLYSVLSTNQPQRDCSSSRAVCSVNSNLSQWARRGRSLWSWSSHENQGTNNWLTSSPEKVQRKQSLYPKHISVDAKKNRVRLSLHLSVWKICTSDMPVSLMKKRKTSSPTSLHDWSSSVRPDSTASALTWDLQWLSPQNLLGTGLCVIPILSFPILIPLSIPVLSNSLFWFQNKYKNVEQRLVALRFKCFLPDF